ncbi:MAG: glycosyltransferase family 39 protein [Saprospiraceae bacterium]
MKIKDNYTPLLLCFGIAKLLLHFFTNTNYGFHRDEYLYLNQGDHLGWGFMEVPPMTPFIGKIASLLGGSIFMTRFFPALLGAITIVLVGLLVKSLGGKKWAIILACGSLLLSPALLGTNTLFQPVSFNQFSWFVCAYFLVKIIQTENPRYWYALGISIGLAWLTKYSIAFYGLGLGIAFLISPQRKWLTTRYPYLALAIALVIAAPNLFWQYEHNWPVFAHMAELQASQLVHVQWGDFLLNQLQFHFSFSLIWLAGLIGLFKIKALQPYRLVGLGFLLTILLIGWLGGKAYYTLGAFTILFAFGGLALEYWLQSNWSRITLFAAMTILVLPSLPYALPLLKIEQMKKYCAYMADNYGLSSRLRWEDGKYYELPQDFADMNGWEELSERLAKVYHALPAEKQRRCMIYGSSYGHACSVNYYRHKYNLPEVYSFSSSCLMWLPNEIDFDTQIMIADEPIETSSWFNTIILKDSIQNPYARDPGYIYYREDPKVDLKQRWKEVVAEEKKTFNF